jgi:hypothetical protein
MKAWDLLLRQLDAAGVDAIYGAAGAWAGVVDLEVPVALAPALVAAHRRVHAAPAGVHLGDGRFVVGDPYAEHAVDIVLADPRDLLDQGVGIAEALAAEQMPRVEIEARFDPEQSVDETFPPARVAPPSFVAPDDLLVDRVRSAERPMMIVGPGVVAAGAVAELHELAAGADLGVLNTWGAKGVFDWRSRHHWATVGLQAHDLELGGVPESDLVLLCGIDPDELPPGALDGRATQVVAPASLGPLAERWTRPQGDGAMPALRTRLAAVTQAGWARTDAPLAPAQVTRGYAEVFGAAGFVAAEPGIAGYWVARTFGTTHLGGAKVPARRSETGAAIACVIVARLRQPRTPALALVDGPLLDVHHELLDEARRLGVPVQVEVWDPDGDALDAAAHVARLHRRQSTGTSVESLATDPAPLDEMVDAAGPVTAWDGLVHRTKRAR